MNLWEDILKTWSDYSPYLHRTLISLEEILKWVKDLKLISNSIEEKNITFFIEYLEKNSLLHPITIAKRNSELAQQIINERGIVRFNRDKDFYEKTDKYYHPFQFIQFLTYLKIYKEIGIEHTYFYFFLRKRRIETMNRIDNKERLLKNIEKEKNTKIEQEIKSRFKGYNRNVKKFSDSRKEKKQKLKKNKKDLKKKLRNSKNNYFDYFLILLRNVQWLKKEYLKIWIKLDSLYLFNNYIYAPNSRFTMYYEAKCRARDMNCREEQSKKFLQWREEKLKNKPNFLSIEEINGISDFITNIETILLRHSPILLDGLENWEDLFELISEEKIQKITDLTSLKINIISIKRFLEKITWTLLEKNLNRWYPHSETKKPYFILDKEDVLDYRKAVLLDFNLFITLPFILYVDGETEVTIMREYLKTKKYGFNYNIENMGGTVKTSYHIKLCKEAGDKEYFFFLDYDKRDDYKKYKGIVGDKGAFFFPDFVTENFSAENIHRYYIDWVQTIGLSFSQQQKEKIKLKLMKSKQKSDELIQMSEKQGKPRGFEKTLINFTLSCFYPELLIKYPQYQINENRLDLDKFKQFFKTQFTENYLKERIRKSLIEDPDRNNEKFPFEEKIKPFLKQIADSVNRNIKIKYEIEDN